MEKIEIERKYLLKAMPKKAPDEKITIDQWYWKNKNNIWERARTYHSDVNGDTWIHTIKRSIGKGISMEDEKSLTLEEYQKFVNQCLEKNSESRYISKERWIYKEGNLKWEVDKFDSGYHLIVAEIEIPTKDFKFKMPSYIKPLLLMEVTSKKKFSNRNLSLKVNEEVFFNDKVELI
jgi:CYTH domain-containing protein